MKKRRFVPGIPVLAVSILGITLSGSTATAPGTPVIPRDGFTTPNNMPGLSWKAVPCDHYEIRIDGRKMDVVDGSRTRYTPFPLSYGQHRWKVVAVSGEKRTESNPAEFVIDGGPITRLPESALLLRTGWKMKSSALVGEGGSVLSQGKVQTDHWYSTSLPASALTVLVRNAVYPNPYTGTNNMKIPDCSDEFNETYDLLRYSHIPGKNPWKEAFWFFRDFDVPASYSARKVRLVFGEINYRAEAWLNGQRVADTSVMVGMERSFGFEVGTMLRAGEKNHLAVAVYPPDHPGQPSPPPLTPLAHPGRNLGADAMLTKDYTKWDMMGWDWQPAVRDRDMGILEDVFLEVPDDIGITDLYITADLPLPDTTTADLTVSGMLVNRTDRRQEGTLEATIGPAAKFAGGQEVRLTGFSKKFTLEPGEHKAFQWDPGSVPELHMDRPRLWWPAGYGEQNLYRFELTARAEEGGTGRTMQDFGIREVETSVGKFERIYRINGRKVYCRGGNWVEDMTLNWTAGRYRDEILLTRNAGLNMLRVWGPTGVPPDVFFDQADRYGIMIWQDFLNDFWGTFKNTPGYTPPDDLFEQHTKDIIKKLRNHPSLVIWCGGNEGPNPREDLIMNMLLPQYDGRDSRHYLRISSGDGVHGGGPYHTILPAAYFDSPKVTGFSSELGPSGVPVFGSIEQFLSVPGSDWAEGRFPIDGEWTYHDATNRTGSDHRKFTAYDDIIRNSYGPPATMDAAGVEDYIAKCQLLNYDVYRACIEAVNSDLWSGSSGFALWKSNSSWPSLTWQVYDWYMQAHAGYYGCRNACEPVHVQFNRDDRSITVINTTRTDIPEATVKAVLYDPGLKEVWSGESAAGVASNKAVRPGLSVPEPDGLTFLSLTVTGLEGEELDRNFYWLSPDEDFTGLSDMEFSVPEVGVEKEQTGERTVFRVNLKNPGPGLVFMLALKLVDGDTGAEVLPSLWSDNYLNLLPGASRSVRVEAGEADLPGNVAVECRGYRTDPVHTNIKP